MTNTVQVTGRSCYFQPSPLIIGDIIERNEKNVIKLDNYYLPGDLEMEISKWVEYYINDRLDESLDNVTPADMCFGIKEKILTQRQTIKQKTLLERKRINLKLRHQGVF
ncbi:MAG: hypothetical protein K9M55_09825, partial [Candidatus Marinimicrobia bacterium]|nr:hypothetical protein [Candidatus Neomarinimicrobiota bacterium]